MKKSIFLCLILCLAVGCRNSAERNPQALFDRIKSSVGEQQFNLAKQQIDSLNTLFRENIALRKAANKVLYEIELVELEQNMAYFSELIPHKKLEMDSIFQYFVFDKAKQPYLSEGKYIHSDIVHSDDPTAIYLKVHLKDSGELFLISIYCGEKDCPYQAVQVSSNDFFVTSPEISINQSSNYAFSDGSYRWRMLLFSDKESLEVIRFISAYANEKITVSLLGNGCFHEYILDEKHKKAIRDTYYLSALIKEVKELQISVINTKKQIENTKRKIEFSDQ